MSDNSWKNAGDWRDAPFLVVLYEYTVKNVAIPTDMGSLIAYFLLLIITWYVMVWATRLVLSLVWPVIMVISAFFLFRFLRTYGHEDLLDMLFQTLTILADASLTILTKALDFIASCLTQNED